MGKLRDKRRLRRAGYTRSEARNLAKDIRKGDKKRDEVMAEAAAKKAGQRSDVLAAEIKTVKENLPEFKDTRTIDEYEAPERISSEQAAQEFLALKEGLGGTDVAAEKAAQMQAIDAGTREEMNRAAASAAGRGLATSGVGAAGAQAAQMAGLGQKAGVEKWASEQALTEATRDLGMAQRGQEFGSGYMADIAAQKYGAGVTEAEFGREGDVLGYQWNQLLPYQMAQQGILGRQERADAKRAQNQALAGQITGAALGAAGAAVGCWVAEELYGEHDERTHAARRWARENDNPFTRAYMKYGKSWAALVRNSRIARAIARPIWDWMARQGDDIEPVWKAYA